MSPDARCGHPGLRSLDAALASVDQSACGGSVPGLRSASNAGALGRADPSQPMVGSMESGRPSTTANPPNPIASVSVQAAFSGRGAVRWNARSQLANPKRARHLSRSRALTRKPHSAAAELSAAMRAADPPTQTATSASRYARCACGAGANTF
jgi:hypothetical protein